MSGNLAGFDANTVDPQSFDVLPAGEYEAIIASSEVKSTAKGDGRYLKLKIQVLSGEYQNRVLFDNLNLWNPSPKATTIAQGTLSSICRAIGIMTPNDSSELHDKPLRIKVVVKNSDQYGPQNEIKDYRPRNGGPSTPPQAGGNPTPWPKPSVEDIGNRF